MQTVFIVYVIIRFAFYLQCERAKTLNCFSKNRSTIVSLRSILLPGEPFKSRKLIKLTKGEKMKALLRQKE